MSKGAATKGANGSGTGGRSNKSKALTYLLWLVGGVCGLHHFYLGRDLQGVLWWCTFGGYFGFGWLRDVFYIGEYVADANRDESYMKKVDYMVRVHEKVRDVREVRSQKVHTHIVEVHEKKFEVCSERYMFARRQGVQGNFSRGGMGHVFFFVLPIFQN